MTTAQDFSNDLILFVQEAKETAAYSSSGKSWEHDFLKEFLSAPDSVRLELAALLNPWRPGPPPEDADTYVSADGRWWYYARTDAPPSEGKPE